MKDLKAIYVEGQMTLIFDENYIVTKKETRAEEFNFEEMVAQLAQQGNFTQEEIDHIMDMPFGVFLDHCRHAETLVEETKQPPMFNAAKMQVLMHPSAYKCPMCGANALLLTDGHLICKACKHDFGDVDDLPEII